MEFVSRAHRWSHSSSAEHVRDWQDRFSHTPQTLAAPGSFPLTLSLLLLAAIVIGGLGTLPGAVWGALVVVFVPDWIGSVNDAVHLPSAVRDQLPLALFGGVFVVAMLAFPHGIQGGLVRLWRLRARRRETGTSEEAIGTT